jgi:hypothetical protein
MLRYFVGFMATIALIILLIFLIFHGGGKSKVPTTSKTLSSYAGTDAEVSLTINGIINADQEHESIKITVSRDSATYTQFQGYQGSVTKLQNYSSNENAYSEFLFALQRAGFTQGSNVAALKDERGFCPLGNRYIFELDQDGQQLERFWATNCGGTPKTYNGNLNLTLTLFKNQIPDFNDLTQNIQNITL